MDEKLMKVAEIFECEAADLTPETRLDTLSWDSVTMLSVMAVAQMAGHALDGEQIREMETVADIMAVV